MLVALQPGATVGEYQVVRRLGEGGMGEVYEAVHAVIGKRAAIKVMKGSVADAFDEARRLLEEARAVNAIHHPGIVDIFGAGVLPDGRPWLVMELLHGETLANRVGRGGPLPLADAAWVLEGVLAPLGAAHRAGVIHRDLKPSNVFLLNDGAGRRVKLLDFGVARRANRTAITAPQMTVGSLGFMSPEQLMGRPVPASDLYALGCIAWVVLTGRPVFLDEKTDVVLQRHLSAEPEPLVRVNPRVPEALAEWVHALLAKKPEARPHSADAALEWLHAAVGSPAPQARATKPSAAPVRPAPARPGTGPSPWDSEEKTERVSPLGAERPRELATRAATPSARARAEPDSLRATKLEDDDEQPLDQDAPTQLHRKPGNNKTR